MQDLYLAKLCNTDTHTHQAVDGYPKGPKHLTVVFNGPRYPVIRYMGLGQYKL